MRPVIRRLRPGRGHGVREKHLQRWVGHDPAGAAGALQRL